MSAVSSIGIGSEICKILKLDPLKTKNIVITFKADDVVKVHVVQYLQDTEVDPLLNALQNYQLEPKPNDGTEEKPTDTIKDTGDTLINFVQ